MGLIETLDFASGLSFILFGSQLVTNHWDNGIMFILAERLPKYGFRKDFNRRKFHNKMEKLSNTKDEVLNALLHGEASDALECSIKNYVECTPNYRFKDGVAILLANNLRKYNPPAELTHVEVNKLISDELKTLHPTDTFYKLAAYNYSVLWHYLSLELVGFIADKGTVLSTIISKIATAIYNQFPNEDFQCARLTLADFLQKSINKGHTHPDIEILLFGITVLEISVRDVFVTSEYDIRYNYISLCDDNSIVNAPAELHATVLEQNYKILQNSGIHVS